MSVRVILFAVSLAVLITSPCFSDSPPTIKIGDELVEKYHADVNGDGVEDAISLRKTVTDVYPFAPGSYDYDAVIEIVEGSGGKMLFKSQRFHTNAIGIFATSGELRILSEKKGPSKLEYVETTLYTEGPTDRVVKVKKYLYEWDGNQMTVKVTSRDMW